MKYSIKLMVGITLGVVLATLAAKAVPLLAAIEIYEDGSQIEYYEDNVGCYDYTRYIGPYGYVFDTAVWNGNCIRA
jgi:hypothetical protein